MDKEFAREFEENVRNTIEKYKLLDKKNKVVVACSGGKDSTTTIYLLKKFGYKVEGLIIDLVIGKWSEKNLANVRKFCQEHGIKLHVSDIRKDYGSSICYIRSGIQSKENLGNCTICGVIKRWILNKDARELKADKLATGHNLDDEAETALMNLLTGSPKLSKNYGPTTGIADPKFVERVKPLYFCTNEEVRRYSKAMDFPVLYEPCPCSLGSFRHVIRRGIANLEKVLPEIKNDIVNSSLQVSGVMSGKVKGIEHCKDCGEPSRNSVCKRCKLMKILVGEHD